MIESLPFLELRNKILNSNKPVKFETDFINSIMFYNAVNIKKYNGEKENIGINMSYKQEDIVEKLIEKYKDNSFQGDIFSRYTKIFLEKNIILDSFDQRHLNNFKGILIESDNFKKWLLQINFINNIK